MADKKIILIDNSVTIQKLISITLADHGYETVIAEEDSDLMEQIRHEQPCLIMADVGSDGVDGYGLCSRLKNEPGLKDVPFILLGGAFNPVDEHEAVKCGADGHIEKPFEAEELLDMVMSHAGSSTGYVGNDSFGEVQGKEVSEEKIENSEESLAELSLDSGPEESASDDADVGLSDTVLSGSSEDVADPDILSFVDTEPDPFEDDIEEIADVDILGTLEDEEGGETVTPGLVVTGDSDNASDDILSELSGETCMVGDVEAGAMPAVERSGMPDVSRREEGREDGLSKEDIEEMVIRIARKVAENVASEIIPGIARGCVREELKKLRDAISEMESRLQP